MQHQVGGTANDRRNASAARMPHNVPGTTEHLTLSVANRARGRGRGTPSRGRGITHRAYPTTTLPPSIVASPSTITINVALTPWPVCICLFYFYFFSILIVSSSFQP